MAAVREQRSVLHTTPESTFPTVLRNSHAVMTRDAGNVQSLLIRNASEHPRLVPAPNCTSTPATPNALTVPPSTAPQEPPRPRVGDTGTAALLDTLPVVLLLARTWQGRSLQRPEGCIQGLQTHLISQCPRPRAQPSNQALSITPGMNSQAVIEPSPHARLCVVANTVGARVTHQAIQIPSSVPRPRAGLPNVEH